MKFMFWNTNKNADIDQIICDIVWENDINIVVLAEYIGDTTVLMERMKLNNIFVGKYFSEGCQKVILLGDVLGVQPGTQENRYSIQIIQDKYILCAMHLPDQTYSDDGRRRIVIHSIIDEIQRLENKLGTKRSILVGDFNEDPFEDGCLSADHFHGLPSKTDASRETRIIEGQSFSMFYNPMWNLFGDFSLPPGTYYYAKSDAKCSFWHIFDQVMIRPCLKDQFVEESLSIITKAGVDSLLDRHGHPDKRISDHLPIVFEIKEVCKNECKTGP